MYSCAHLITKSKMESFIRSKYESKRWAMEGPPPLNPSDLENSVKTSALQLQHAPSPPSASQSSHTSTANITTRTPATTRQPQPHPLLSTNFATNLSQRETTVPSTSASVPASALVQPKAPENDLFSLDFHAPTPPAPPVPEALKKDVKQDILSLFSSPQTASVPGASTLGQSGTTSAASPWVTQAAIPQQEQQPITSMLGTSGVGTWGVSSGWGAPAAAPPAHNNLWGASQTGLTSQQQSGIFNTSAVWGSSLSAPTAPAQETFGSFTSSSMATSPGLVQSKKDDVFGDLWGGFK
ncbi:hypothetical protein C0989_003924 [Termitomyces sp. Mn162]|nr:hypothetical protein C0989_003924 [Termitomyces sp. Mn162]